MAQTEATKENLRRWRELWEDEIAGAALYRALASSAEGNRRDVLLQLARAEERHAAHWAKLLAEAGVTNLGKPRMPMRMRLLGWAAKRFGPHTVLPVVLKMEARDAGKYDREAGAAPGMATDERMHGKVVESLTGDGVGGRIVRMEGRHRLSVGGALRASVFGVNDGLVSNLSLVMGMAGGVTDNGIVLLAGVAGLLAGSFSMAAGEFVSVRSQRELQEREIETERLELEHFPQEEREELALIYQAKGIDRDQARVLADRIMSEPRAALETLVREELGLDPGDLPSPWTAALSSFIAFALGAVVPVIPFFATTGDIAVVLAAALAGAGLFGVGALITVFTGKGALRSGVRMVAIGAVAAAITYGIGTAVGVGVS